MSPAGGFGGENAPWGRWPWRPVSHGRPDRCGAGAVVADEPDVGPDLIGVHRRRSIPSACSRSRASSSGSGWPAGTASWSTRRARSPGATGGRGIECERGRRTAGMPLGWPGHRCARGWGSIQETRIVGASGRILARRLSSSKGPHGHRVGCVASTARTSGGYTRACWITGLRRRQWAALASAPWDAAPPGVVRSSIPTSKSRAEEPSRTALASTS